MKAYLIYENEDWMPPLRRALEAADVPYEEWFVDDGHFDLQEAPPEGVFLNRMSASSHTRGHTAGVEHTRQLLSWLERHGRRVVNGRNAFELEISKVKQHLALEETGLRTPATRAVAGGGGGTHRSGSGGTHPVCYKAQSRRQRARRAAFSLP